MKSYQKNELTLKRDVVWSRDLCKFLVPYDIKINISGTAKARDFKFSTLVCQVTV